MYDSILHYYISQSYMDAWIPRDGQIIVVMYCVLTSSTEAVALTWNEED